MQVVQQTTVVNDIEVTINRGGDILFDDNLQLSALQLDQLVLARRRLDDLKAMSLPEDTQSGHNISFVEQDDGLLPDVCDGIWVGCQFINREDLFRIHQISQNMRRS